MPVLVGPRMARTGASERGAMHFECGSASEGRKFRRCEFRPLLTLIRHHGARVDVTKPRASAAAVAFAAWPRPGWKSAGALALLCSTVAWASLPRAGRAAAGRAAAMAGAGPGAAVERRRDRHGDGADRTAASRSISRRSARRPAGRPAAEAAPAPSAGPLRIRGRAGEGLYWSLRAAGASPQVAAQYLAALATEIDVGEVASRRRLRPGAREPIASCSMRG